MAAAVPSDCIVLNVIEWLPRDETLPGFVFLTFIGFFVIGALLALLVLRCAAWQVEAKKRSSNTFTSENGKDVWVFSNRVYLLVSLLLVLFFLITFLVVLILFVTRNEDDKVRSEEGMSNGFSSSVWVWFLLAGVILLPLFGYLVLKCILFPGKLQALKQSYKVYRKKKQQKKGKTKEHIVLVHVNQTKTKHFGGVFAQNRVSPITDEEALPLDGSAASKVTLTSSIRSTVDEKKTETNKRYGHSIVEVLTKDSSEQMNLELQGQDLQAVVEMEDNLLKNKGETFVNVWRMILDVLFNNGRISEIFRRDSIATLEQAVEDIGRNNKDLQDKETQKAMTEIEDPTELEDAIENIHAKYRKKMNSELIALQSEAATNLKTKSTLSEEESDAIILKVKSSLASCEKFFVEEQTRQSMVLQEKLLRRQALMQLRDQLNNQEKEAIENAPQKHSDALDKLCQDGKLHKTQKDEILSGYEENLAKLQQQHEQAVLAQQTKLAAKLQQRREEKIRLLELRQEKEREEHYKLKCREVSDGEITLEAFVQEQTELSRKHAGERGEEEDEADRMEAEELERLRQHLEEEREKEMNSYETGMLKRLGSMTELSNDEMQRFIEEHKRDLALYNEKLEESKNQQRMQLKEKLQERKVKLERERAQHKSEQTQLITQQEEVMDQVLKMQVGLTEEMRKQVMIEHEQNLMNLNNHLQISRLRQQKRLEARLAQRKAELAEMKATQNDEITTSGNDDPAKLEKLVQTQNKAYEEKLKKIEEEHERALENLRSRLALETEEALKEQDKRLGEILGKLQVGVARRDEIIRRQNETIKAIENKLVDKLTREGTFAENSTDKILKQHQREIAKLEAKISETKEAQEKSMLEKLEAKRLRKERILSAKHNEQVEQKRTRGVRSATRVIMDLLDEKQHQQKIDGLRREMELELAKQKEELNKLMEEKLMEELQLHERNFVTQLASISNMKEDEISKICNEAVKEHGGDKQAIKKLSKDLRKRFRSVKEEAIV